MLLGAVWQSATPLCMDFRTVVFNIHFAIGSALIYELPTLISTFY